MNTLNYDALLTASSLTRIDKACAIKKANINFEAKLYLCMMTIILLLMSGEGLSAVIDDIKSDMLLNEATLLNAPPTWGWAVGAAIGMGSAPRGDATPPSWIPTNTDLKSSSPWNAVVPWFVIFPGTANAAKNVRIKVYGATIYFLLKSTNKWKKIDTGSGNPTWAQVSTPNYSSIIGKSYPRIEADGYLSYKFDADSNPIHGGAPRYQLSNYGIDPSDVNAVYVNFKTQLILDDPLGADDRSSAQILVQVGADYYPTMTTTSADFAPVYYTPALGFSRFGLVKSLPRTHHMATISSARYITPSDYVNAGGQTTIPFDQFAANMPPEFADSIAPTAPSGLGAIKKIDNGFAVITLSWTASKDNVAVAGYDIYRNGRKINVSTINSYIDSLGIATGYLYSYTVKAFDAVGNRSDSSKSVDIVY